MLSNSTKIFKIIKKEKCIVESLINVYIQVNAQIHKIAKIADDFYVPLKGYASDP
jgi:hypothetical protein